MTEFNLIEPSSKDMSSHLADPFSLVSMPSPIHVIARMTTGSIDYSNSLSGKVIKPRENYLTQSKALRSPIKIIQSISENLDKKDYVFFLEQNKYKNIEFFKRLRDELAQCIYHLESGSPSESFMHLFRCIEFMSEACGVLYVSYQDDFNKSMEFFRAVYTEDGLGPLGLLSKTAAHISKHEGLDEVTFDYKPPATHELYLGALGSQFNSIGINGMNNVSYSWNEIDGYNISVGFAAVPNFISTIRNRTYHNQRSTKNIDLYKIGGFSRLAEMMTPPTISWFATMYFTLLRALISRSN